MTLTELQEGRMSRAQHQRLLERVRVIEEVAPGHHQGAWRVDSKGPRRRRFTGGEFACGCSAVVAAQMAT